MENIYTAKHLFFMNLLVIKNICVKYYNSNTHTQTHTHTRASTHARTHRIYNSTIFIFQNFYYNYVIFETFNLIKKISFFVFLQCIMKKRPCCPQLK